MTEAERDRKADSETNGTERHIEPWEDRCRQEAPGCTAMDGVLERAAVVCVCKLACSLLFLPIVTGSVSAISFCSSCLLLFTDLVVTTFLVVLWFGETWLPVYSVSTDVIALRFLLFLSHTYWAVLLMTTPLVAVETAVRLQCSEGRVGRGEMMDRDAGEGSKALGSKALEPYSADSEQEETGQCRDADPEKSQVAGREGQENGRYLSPIYFFCCLLVWVLCGLVGGQGLRLEDVSVVDCLERTSSLTICLPSIPYMVLLALGEPCWGLAAVTLTLLLVLTLGWGLLRQHLAHTETDPDSPIATQAHREEWGIDVPTPFRTFPEDCLAANPAVQSVVPVTTWVRSSGSSSCSRNNTQLFAGHHGDLSLLSVECLSADRLEGRKETTGEMPLGTTGDHQAYSTYLYISQCGIITGFVCLLTVCMLPLNLSVNIPLICHVEAMLLWSLKLLLSVPEREINNWTAV
ncbi:hypothetical protein UPYG_G00173880 [Umbra pygmaea]|uniref:Transmembrane protein n=1 Tax=Umbra pygmaea TaxID=75934 RepID=A0ABD0WU62_UMBPY